MNNLNNVTPELIQNYAADIGDGVSFSTIKRRLSSLKKFFDWAHKEGRVNQNPFATNLPEVITPSKTNNIFSVLNIIKFISIGGVLGLTVVGIQRLKIPINFIPGFAQQEQISPIAQNIPTPLPTSLPSGTPMPIIPTATPTPSPSLSIISALEEIKSIGDLLIEGKTITLQTLFGSGGDITLHPDTGKVNLLFDSNKGNLVNAQAANLNSGSLFYGLVGNNSTGYSLITLQSGSNPTTKFSVDGQGNTIVAGNLNLTGGNLQIGGVTRFNSLGRLASITGYYQDSGLFEIDQGGPDFARITKSQTATADVLTLTLNETGKTASNQDTLVLNRTNAGTTGYALDVRSGNVNIAEDLTVGDALTVSGSLTVRGTTIATTGNLETTGNLRVDGDSTLGDASSDTTTVNGQGIFKHIPSSAHTGTWAIGSSTWNVSDSALYINPASSVADGNLLGAAVAGSVKFSVDAEGDVFGRNLVLTGTTTTGTTTVAGDLTVEGNTTLGDASTDTLTFNALTLAIPNNLNIDANTLYIDAANNRVGIGTSSPATTLDVNGGGTFATGLRVGFAGAPGSTSRIEVGDGTFYIDRGNSLLPLISFDPNDYFAYYRPGDYYQWVIGGGEKLNLSGTQGTLTINNTTTSTIVQFVVNGSQSNIAGLGSTGLYGANFTPSYATGTNPMNLLLGVQSNPLNNATGTGANALNNLWGFYSNPGNTSTGTTTSSYGFYSAPYNNSSGTITQVLSFLSQPNNVSTGTIGTVYGFYAAAPLNAGGGTISNKYAFVSEAEAGNVGIGTTTPGALLDVFKSGTNQPIAQFGGSAVTDAPTLRLYNGAGRIELFAAGTTNSYITGTTQGDVGIVITSGDDFFLGNQNTTPYLTIKDGGAVGIGTASPATIFHVVAESSVSTNDFLNDSSFPNFVGRRHNGTFGSPTNVLNSQAIVRFFGNAYGATGFSTKSDGGVEIRATENWSDSAQGDQIQFWTTANGSTTPAAKAVLDNNGNFGIGASLTPNNQFVVAQSGATQVAAATGTIGVFANDALTAGTYAVAITTDDASAADEYFLAMQSEEDSAPDNEFLFRTNGQLALDNGTLVTPADIAEMYWVNGRSEPGDLVAIETDSSKIADAGKTVRLSSGKTYDGGVMGIVSTQPGHILGYGDADHVDPKNDPRQPIALAGRVPVKVNLQNGAIKKGDRLTSSSLPGVAMKATRGGPIVAIALEDYDGKRQLSQGTVVTESERLSIDRANQPIAPPQPGVGKIMAFINISTYEPEPNLAEKFSDAIDYLADSISKGASSIYKDVAGFGELIAKGIKTTRADVEELIASNKIISPVIETALISPVPDQKDIAIKIGNPNATESGQLLVKNKGDQTVASIDEGGNASFGGQVKTSGLAVSNNATISGSLYADTIKSKSLDDIEKLLKNVAIDQKMLSASSSWNINTATMSADLNVANVYVTNKGVFNALSSNQIFTTSIDSLTAPLSIQSLAMQPVEIMAGRIKINTNGDVEIHGNLNVAGNINITDGTGGILAGINATGSAQFKDIKTGQVIIATDNAATISGLVNGEITTNATAGTASIPSGVDEITIKNSRITDYTLVYVTPTSPTNNQVLYVKAKGNGFFKVGFTQPANTDVTFNWWVIDVK